MQNKSLYIRQNSLRIRLQWPIFVVGTHNKPVTAAEQ